MEVDKTQENANSLKELLERQANLGTESLDQEDDAQKGGNEVAEEDDDEEVIMTTRRRRLVKKTKQEVVEDVVATEEPTPAETERPTGGRRLRRAAAKKQIVMTSDDDDDSEERPEAAPQKQSKTEDDEEYGGATEAKNRSRKGAKLGNKKPKKLTGGKTAAKGVDNEEMFGGKYQVEDDDEELVRTPASSQHPSEDENDDEPLTPAKPAKKTKGQKKATAAGASKRSMRKKGTEDDQVGVNTIKSRNRLVGDLQNNDLYGDDEDDARPIYQLDHEMEGEEKLDLGFAKSENAPKKQFNFLNKGASAQEADINSKIQQLGFSKETNVNELAARGVQISIRDQLIRKLQQQELKQQEQENQSQQKLEQAEAEQKVTTSGQDGGSLLLEETKGNLVTSSETQNNLRAMVDKFCTDANSLKQKADGKLDKTVSVVPVVRVNDDDDGSEDEDGLEFIDPAAIEREKVAETIANKEREQKPKMVLINGKMVPAMSVTLNNAAATVADKQNAGRSALFSQLRGQIMKKTSKNIDIAHIQSTFKTQDLQSKKKEDVTVEDALAHDLEKGASQGEDAGLFPDDDDDDESYKAADGAKQENLEQAVNHNWDDEENIKSITEGDLADCIQSSVDGVSNDGSSAIIKGSGKATPGSLAGKSQRSQRPHAKSMNESMEEADIAEALKSNESSLGAGDLLRRKEMEAERVQKAAKARKQKNAAARFMDLEAELGSDNEENDDRIKKINRTDLEEDENGLDDSLDGFVDNEQPAGDDEEIEAANQAARDLFLARQAEDEREAVKKTLGAVFYGQNKKRKRGEIEFDDMDEQEKIYYKRREERLQNELLDEQEEDDQAAIDREAEKNLREAAEDEMSDEEVQKQIESYKLFKQKREMQMLGEKSLYNRYTNVAAKEKQEADYLDNLIVDETQTKTVASQALLTSQAVNSSVVSSKVSKQQSAEQPTTVQIDTSAQRRKPVVPQKYTTNAQMLDRKKVLLSDQGVREGDEKRTAMGAKEGTTSTATTSKTDKLSGGGSNAAGLRAIVRAKRQIVGTGSSMMSLVKTGDNQGQGAVAKTKRPLMFGAYKKGTV